MKSWILGLAALLLLFNLQAKASVLIDWGSVPESQKHLEPTTSPPVGPNGTYTTGADFSNVLVSVAGSGFVPSGLHDPKVDVTGHPFSVPVLSTTADFKASPSGPGTVTFTIDFFGFKQGVKDVSFTLFNIDADNHGSNSVADVVTFKTAGLTLTGGANNHVSGNTVTGTGESGPESIDSPQGNVTVRSGNLPLHQIVFNWTRPSSGPGENLDEIAIGNISFTPVPEVGQLAIGLVACLLGAIWLHKNRRKRAHSIP